MFSQSHDEGDELAMENARIAEDAAKDSDYHTFTPNVAVSIKSFPEKNLIFFFLLKLLLF